MLLIALVHSIDNIFAKYLGILTQSSKSITLDQGTKKRIADGATFGLKTSRTADIY